MNKNAMTMSVLIGIIIALLSFIVVSVFLTSTSSMVMDEFGEIQCRGSLEAQSTRVGKLIDFFLQVSKSCPIDSIESDYSQRDDVFNLVAERSHSCWRRYGEGELDFLSSYEAEGNFCFPCSEISFEEDSNFQYDYNEFIDWTKENSPGRDSNSFYESIRFPYIDTNTEEYDNLEANLMEALNEIRGDEELEELEVYLTDYLIDIEDMQNRQISSNQDLKIVLRYQRFDEENMNEIVGNIARDAATGIVVGTIAGAVLKGPVSFFVGVSRFAVLASKVAAAERVARYMRHLSKVKTFSAVGGAAGGIAGSQYSDNYVQYVEVMSEEEYYRNCGVW